jgi:hypothetical protein
VGNVPPQFLSVQAIDLPVSLLWIVVSKKSPHLLSLWMKLFANDRGMYRFALCPLPDIP